MQSDPPPGPVPTDPSPASDDPLVGAVLADRYRIVRKLGEGGMGAVYMGEHLRFGRLDAIKVLRDTMSRDPESTERFLRGARNASAIQHPNVCTVYDFSDAGGVQFLAMEYVEGETLADVLERDGPVPVDRALDLARQVAAALGAAHELGIVHRDLKPGNVMLARTRDGGERVKVVDFDIAKGSAEGEARDVTRAGFVVGTPEYMSPEQLTGDPLDGRSDLYSLGIVLFRSLTGSIPSRAANTQDLMVERLTADPLRLADVVPDGRFPPGVQDLLDRLLERRREDRPGSARETIEAIDAVLAGGRIPPAPGAAPSAGPPRGPGVGPSPVVGGGPAPAGGGATPRWALPAVAGGAVVVAALAFALLSRPGPSGAEADRAGGSVAEDPAAASAPDARGSGTEPADGPPDDGGAAGSTEGGSTADTDRTADAGDAARPDPGIDGGGSAEDTGGGAGPAGPGAAAAEDVLFRQLDLVGTEAGLARLAAGEDTARMLWEQTSAGAGQRGLAAYVLGNLLLVRGDTAGAIRWLERAVETVPGYEPYRTQLATLRGGG